MNGATSFAKKLDNQRLTANWLHGLFDSWRIISFVTCSVIFLADFALARGGHLEAWDHWVRRALYHNLDAAAPTVVLNSVRTLTLVDVTVFGRDASLPIAALVCAIGTGVFFLACRSKNAILLPLTVMGAALLASILKVSLPIAPPKELHLYGFPSGHAATSLALACFATLTLRSVTTSSKMRVGASASACFYVAVVGVAVLKYHYASEIVGGYALAGAWLALLSGRCCPTSYGRFIDRRRLRQAAREDTARTDRKRCFEQPKPTRSRQSTISLLFADYLHKSTLSKSQAN